MEIWLTFITIYYEKLGTRNITLTHVWAYQTYCTPRRGCTSRPTHPRRPKLPHACTSVYAGRVKLITFRNEFNVTIRKYILFIGYTQLYYVLRFKRVCVKMYKCTCGILLLLLLLNYWNCGNRVYNNVIYYICSHCDSLKISNAVWKFLVLRIHEINFDPARAAILHNNIQYEFVRSHAFDVCTFYDKA
jgi:hypothetical protein